MSDLPNQHQNTPSGADLDAAIAADEAARANTAPPEPETAVAPSEAAPEPSPEAPQPEPEGQPEETEFEKRISRLAYEKRAAEKQARQLREELARARGEAPPAKPDEEMERLVAARAAQLAAQQSYNDKANAIYNRGVAEFPDFDAKLVALRELGAITPQLVEACDEVGDAHKVIHYLCRNIDEAERIMNMSPQRMGAAIAKIGAKLNAPKPVSKAPEPIRPVSGHANTSQSIEDSVRTDGNLGDIDSWMRREDERWAQRRWRH